MMKAVEAMISLWTVENVDAAVVVYETDDVPLQCQLTGGCDELLLTLTSSSYWPAKRWEWP